MVDPRTVTVSELLSPLQMTRVGADGLTNIVETSVDEVIRHVGRSIPTLVKLLYPAAHEALLPWVIETAATPAADEVFSWCSPQLTSTDPHLSDPDSTVSLASLAKEGLVVATYADGGLAGIAGRPSDPALLELQRRVLTGADFDTIIATMASTGCLATVVSSTCRPSSLDRPPAVHAALALPTIDHLCAHIVSVRPELDTRPSSIGRCALRTLDATPSDALHGSPSPYASIVAGSSAVTPAPPPDPLAEDAAWLAWLQEPVTPQPFAISRLLCDVYRRRIDLQQAFPDLQQAHHRLAYLRWATAFAADPPTSLPSWAIPGSSTLPQTEPPSSLRRVGRGITVIGYLESALGLGEAARIMVRNCRLTGEAISTRTWRHLVSPPVKWRDVSPDVVHDIHLICINGGDLAAWNHSAPPGFHDGAYRIGLWFWETDRIPDEMAAGAQFVDEIWVTSKFTAAAVRSVLNDVVVKVVPLGIDLTHAPTTSRATDREVVATRIEQRLGTRLEPTSQWWCGFSFDLSSHLERKNPLGLIDAWRRTFPTETEQACLIVKTMQGHLVPEAGVALTEAIEGRGDIVHVDDAWNADDHHRFIRALDVYASLHRSEGYGLALLEALAVGTPVVATGSTGNTAFMNEHNSWVVPSVTVPARHANRGYQTTGNVAEPDVDVAVDVLTTLFESRFNPASEAQQRAMLAQREVAPLADGTAAAVWIRRRLAEIRRALAASEQRNDF